MTAFGAEECVRVTLSHLRSVYVYTVSALSADRFSIEWSRRPSPHEPLPALRVVMEVQATRRPGTEAEYELTAAMAAERCELRLSACSASSLDAVILRALKAKAEFYKTKLPPEQETERLHYSAYAPPPVAASSSSLQHWAALVSQLAAQTQGQAEAEDRDAAQQQQSAPPPALRTRAPAVRAAAAHSSELEDRLISLFRAADTDGSGRLSVAEVRALLLSSEAELGLSQSLASVTSLVSLVMAAYDSNGDGQLVWAEWLPVAVDLLQTAAALREARQAVEQQRQTLGLQLQRRLGADTQQAELQAAFAALLSAADPSGCGLLPSERLLSLLRQLPLALSDAEQAALLLQLERSRAGAVLYSPLQADCVSFIAAAIERCAWQSACSPLELRLLAACRERDEQGAGALPSAVLAEALQAVSGGALSGTQLCCLLNDEPAAAADGPLLLLDCAAFCHKAALVLLRLFSSRAVEERTELQLRGAVPPVALLTPADRERVEAELLRRFHEFDTNCDGRLDQQEFAACMADTSLCLSSQQIESLRQSVLSSDGLLHCDQFMTLAYTQLLHIAREAQIDAQANCSSSGSSALASLL